MIAIRPATPDDLPALLEFEQGVIAAERPFDPTLAPDPIHYYDLEALLANERAQVVVAVDGDVVVGTGYARIDRSETFLRHKEHAYLGMMYVRPSHRGRGINALVVGALEAWAAAHGITEARLEVYVGNQPAIGAYERIGFTKHIHIMRKGITAS